MVASYQFDRQTEDDLITVLCTVDNVDMPIAFDTGASHTVIDFASLVDANYRLGDTVGLVPVVTANGVVLANRFRLKRFEVLGIVRTDFIVTSFILEDASLTMRGVLGLDFLENYEFCINMPQQIIKLKTV
jgi:predicted aspartyl protease